MPSKDAEARMELLANRAIERLESLIAIMEKAADHVASGKPLDEVEVGEFLLCMSDNRLEPAITCIWSTEEYFDLLEAVTSEAGVCLDDAQEFSINLPETEFKEGMVTGDFMAWKGFSVEMKNEPLEDLLDCICMRLKRRGMALKCTSEEYVMFQLPVHRSSSG